MFPNVAAFVLVALIICATVAGSLNVISGEAVTAIYTGVLGAGVGAAVTRQPPRSGG